MDYSRFWREFVAAAMIALAPVIGLYLAKVWQGDYCLPGDRRQR